LIVAALPWEARTALGSLRAIRSETHADGRLTEGVSETGARIAVLVAGMGPLLVAEAADWAIARSRPAAIVSTGCAGGLDPELRAGDVVVAETIRIANGRGAAVAEEWAQRLRRAAERAGLDARSGPIFSSPAILDTVAAKRAARSASAAIAVEMEAAAIAAAAHRADVPFAAARAILDGAETEVVFARDLVAPDGRVRPAAVARAILRGRRRTIGELVRLAVAQRACARSLRALHAALLREIPPVANPGGVR
jgi:adenosylhomocysteine nucleosidase